MDPQMQMGHQMDPQMGPQMGAPGKLACRDFQTCATDCTITAMSRF